MYPHCKQNYLCGPYWRRSISPDPRRLAGGLPLNGRGAAPRRPGLRPSVSQTAERPRVGYRRPAWFCVQGVVLAGLISFLWGRILVGLVTDWVKDPNYSHGFVVLSCSAWIIWRRRDHIADQVVKPSWQGLVIIVGAVALLSLGVFGAELFLSRTSFIILLAGLIIQLRGWRWFSAVLFPWAILFLAVPLPAIIFNRIALPLEFEASRLATGMLGAIGIPVLRQGNVIVLPSLTLNIVEACSGLRSLVSLITLAVIYGYFFESRAIGRILLILAAVPIAVLANGFRIMGSGALGECWSPEKAEGFFHLFSGLAVFAVSVALLVGFHSLICWLGRGRWARRAQCA
jgi:exosortase